MPRQDSNLLRSITAALSILASIIMPVAEQYRRGQATESRLAVRVPLLVLSRNRNLPTLSLYTSNLAMSGSPGKRRATARSSGGGHRQRVPLRLGAPAPHR